MTVRSAKPRGNTSLPILLAGILIVTVSFGSATPALAKHHHRKPLKLWKQYPLNVERGTKPTPVPSHRSLTRSSPQATRRGPSELARDVSSRDTPGGDGIPLAVLTGALLAVIGIVLIAVRRETQPAAQYGRRLVIPGPAAGKRFMTWSGTIAPVLRRFASMLAGKQVVDWSRVQRATRRGWSWAARLIEAKSPSRPSGARNTIGLEQAPQPHEDEPGSSRVHGAEANDANRASASPPPEGCERVHVQLVDGRSLDGWIRDAGSDDQQLLVLDLITSYDSKGNEIPGSSTDSFILRSEIESMQRIDGS
jgi:hypothetical protein